MMALAGAIFSAEGFKREGNNLKGFQDNLKGFQDFFLKAKARIWPELSCMCHTELSCMCHMTAMAEQATVAENVTRCSNSKKSTRLHLFVALSLRAAQQQARNPTREHFFCQERHYVLVSHFKSLSTLASKVKRRPLKRIVQHFSLVVKVFIQHFPSLVKVCFWPAFPAWSVTIWEATRWGTPM